MNAPWRAWMLRNTHWFLLHYKRLRAKSLPTAYCFITAGCDRDSFSKFRNTVSLFWVQLCVVCLPYCKLTPNSFQRGWGENCELVPLVRGLGATGEAVLRRAWYWHVSKLCSSGCRLRRNLSVWHSVPVQARLLLIALTCQHLVVVWTRYFTCQYLAAVWTQCSN